MSKFAAFVIAALLSTPVAVSPALAQHGGGGGSHGGGDWHGGGGWHGGGWHGGVFFGVGPWWGWGYPYGYGYPYYGYAYPPPYPYPYPQSSYAYPDPNAYAAAPPPTATPAPTAPSQGAWYYCRRNGAYYPYVKECAEGWEQVPAHPAQ
jgi:hypothetical protein